MKANNPFLILGVSPAASDETILAAYRQRLSAYPPDREPEKFKEISEAYTSIQNSKSRFKLWMNPHGFAEKSMLTGLGEAMKYMPPPTPQQMGSIRKRLREC